MPIVDGNYVNPGWVDNSTPDMDAAELNAISNTCAKVLDKATTAEAIAGTNDTKCITPLGAATATRELIANQKWTLLATYQTAGAFTFTVPAGYTKLGAYMIGGGGSGAATYPSGGAVASGGASGYGKNLILNVTPGQQIAGVVGAGGVSVTINGYGSNGNAGGTTSFGGSTVSGGSGGYYLQSSNSYMLAVSGAPGGQGSDAISGQEYPISPRELFGSRQTLNAFSGSSTGGSKFANGGRSQSPKESQNIFDPLMVTLCAGGGAGASYYSQVMTATDLGHKGGDGCSATDSQISQGVSGNGGDGVGPGSGGGALRRDTSSTAYHSGAGAPGAVYIYGVKE